MSVSPNHLVSTDNELLMQFVRYRDEEAFGQLAERHAALLMSVCRRVTQNEQDAEDAFQATLLILARRADRLMGATSLGGWLHRVAFRAAIRARTKSSCENQPRLVVEPAIDEEDALRDIHVREIQRVLHEELSKIASRYRNAIVLCDLEGKTRLEAAEQLDCTEASVKAALARGRRCLRFRLLKRGTLLSWGMITASKAIASTRVSPDLLQQTVTLGCQQVSARDLSPNVSDSVQTLVSDGVAAMTHSAIVRFITTICIVGGLIAAPLLLAGQITGAQKSDVEFLTVSQTEENAEIQPISVQTVNSNSSRLSGDTKRSEPDLTISDSDQRDRLTNELFETLRQLIDYRAQLLDGGDWDQIDSLIQAQKKLFELRWGMVGSRTERISLLEKRVHELRELEKIAETRIEDPLSGLDHQSTLLAVKAKRLEAQLTLLKERQTAGELIEADSIPMDETAVRNQKPVLMVKVERGYFPVSSSGNLLPPSEYSATDVRKCLRAQLGGHKPIGGVGSKYGYVAVTEAARIATVLGDVWEKARVECITLRGSVGKDSPTYALLPAEHGISVIWGHAPGSEVEGEAKASEKVKRLTAFARQNLEEITFLPSRTTVLDLRPLEAASLKDG